MTPTQNQETAPAAPTTANAAAPPRASGRRRAFTIFFLVLLLLAVGIFLYWMHARQFESTDDAFVEMHLDPLSARVDGTIVKVYVEDNQSVRAGDPLVDLDPRDLQVAVDQATAALNQARSQVTAQQPNIPITQEQNTANVAGGNADVANAEAAVGAARTRSRCGSRAPHRSRGE